ncbi:hypothetical protein AADG42_12415 [Ammonicoccus fulvus]|uniref:Lipoprotein n=1 Tax=Ammonicoccus fulvus TaxID=3138240 RepID=A0ABZ3FTC8_9ACTN
MSRIVLVALLALVLAFMPGCVRSPRVEGHEWRPVNVIGDADGESSPLGVVFYLPDSRSGGLDERVDPQRYLIVELHYDGCPYSDPRFVGVGADRLEVRFTELLRECVRPIPMTAWFAIPWDELPAEVLVIDQFGENHVIRDRRLAG